MERVMKAATRMSKFSGKDWAIRNFIFMNGLRYNIEEGFSFYWCGGSWRSCEGRK